MKKCGVIVLAVLVTAPAFALDLGNGFSFGGGVKTGIEIKSSDFTGRLEAVDPDDEYPFTLFFASKDNDTYNGEGWLDFNYASTFWGLHLGAWAHGSVDNFDDTIHLGDHYLWANFFKDKLQFKGGQGGGAPISTGGWLNVDWLSYTGLRLFGVDVYGISLGLNFPDPGKDGIKPDAYFSNIMIGAKYKLGSFAGPLEGLWAVFMYDNNPIYDDSEKNTIIGGGLHYVNSTPIAGSGNIAFGAGIDSLVNGRLILVFDGMVNNLGEDYKVTGGPGSYQFSPVEATFAFKGGFKILEMQDHNVYAEVRAKYITRNGDNKDDTGSTAWGQFQIEPYVKYRLFNQFNVEFSLNLTTYINSAYLARDILAGGRALSAGWVSDYEAARDYFSYYQLSIDPAISTSFGGATVIAGYNGVFSRDHARHNLYVDFRWAF
ncbi:hypothetical protein FACS1894164_21090 [Spirochaetia bacterium]|nr:hypothetical protein FACS1894164_21090 [Spirochaetia bacterium]